MSTVKITNSGNDLQSKQIETIYDKTTYYVPATYSNTISRYQDTIRVQDLEDTNKTPHINLYKFNIPYSTDDKIITASINTRLDVLADTYYNNATLWWAIAMASNITDPFDISVGQFLRIPPLSSLYEENSVLQRR